MATLKKWLIILRKAVAPLAPGAFAALERQEPPPDSLLLRSAARRDVFAYIDSLPWDRVRPKGVPRGLRRLISDDEDERMDAICGFLYDSVFHQYTLYPATPFAMLSVGRILTLPDVPDLSSGMDDGPMAFHLLQFIRSCAERGQAGIRGKPYPAAPTIEQAASECASLCGEFLTHAHPGVRAEAEALRALATRAAG